MYFNIHHAKTNANRHSSKITLNMELPLIFLISLGLAMDALTVSICYGMNLPGNHTNHAFFIALSFGFFQAALPVLGWLAGKNLSSLIQSADHWIAFGLLAFIGGKMIFDSTGQRNNCVDENFRLTVTMLLAASVAVSIDALAVGLSFALLKTAIWLPVFIIGATTFVLSFLGVMIGKSAGKLFRRNMQILGGLILIGIGIKILVEHLAA